MNKKLIFEYMGWNFIDKCRGLKVRPHCFLNKCDNCDDLILDGNDMVEAKNKMVEKGEWREFHNFARNLYYTTNRSDLKIDYNFAAWLMQPNRFFELLSEALEKGILKAD